MHGYDEVELTNKGRKALEDGAKNSRELFETVAVKALQNNIITYYILN